MRLFDSEKEMNSNSVVLSNVITIEIDKIIKLSADDNDSLFITTDKELLRIKKLSDGSYSLYTNDEKLVNGFYVKTKDGVVFNFEHLTPKGYE